MKTKFILSSLMILATAADAMGYGSGTSSPRPSRKGPVIPAQDADSDPFKNLKLQTSPFAACRDVTFISTEDMSRNGNFWQKAIAECPDLGVQVMPESHYFTTIRSMLLTSGASASGKDFLNKLGSRVKQQNVINGLVTEHLQKCAAHDEAWFKEKNAKATTDVDKEFYDYSKCEDTLAKLRTFIDTSKECVDENGKTFKNDGGADFQSCQDKMDVAHIARVENEAIRLSAGIWNKVKGGIRTVGDTIAAPFGAEESKIMLDSVTLTEKEKAQAKAIIDREEAEMESQARLSVERNKMIAMDAIKANPKVDPAQIPGIDEWFKQALLQNAVGPFMDTDTMKEYAYAHLEGFFKKPLRAQKLLEHRQKMNAALESAPIAGFLDFQKDGDKYKPLTDEQIAAAAARNLAYANAERKKLDDILRYGTNQMIRNGRAISNPSEEDRVKAMLDLLENGPILRQMLAENPGDCSIATGLLNMVSKAKTSRSVIITAAAVGGSVAVAMLGVPAVMGAVGAGALSASTVGWLGAGVGLGTSIASLNSTYPEFVAAKQRSFGMAETLGVVTYGDETAKPVADMKTFLEARDTFAMDVATLPLNMIGTGVFSWSTSNGINFFKNVWQRPGARKALTEMMKAKGMADDVIAGLFKSLDSSDVKIATKAYQDILKGAGFTDDQLKLAASARWRGLTGSSPAYRAIMTQEKSAAVYTKAWSMIDEAGKAGKLNQGNVEAAYKAAIAGADFGETNPAKLMAAIKEWEPKGLDNLASIYERGAVKLKDPSFGKGLTQAARQQKAWEESLSESLQASPNPDIQAKIKSKEGLKAMVDEMSTCVRNPAAAL